MKNNLFITKASDLVTTREDTRTGFITMALEKNYLAVPYIDEAKALKTIAKTVKSPWDLLEKTELKSSLVSASGLSEKALTYLNNDDLDEAIKGLIENFLEPAGENFADELVYRYLLVKGDALGGKARNLAGTLGERKFLKTLLSLFNLYKQEYYWLDNEDRIWKVKPEDTAGLEKRIKALSWKKEHKDRVLVLNVNVPIVTKNVDLCLLNGRKENLVLNGSGSTDSIHRTNEAYIALGELKGGIDPAGADEHWKTANTALQRIKTKFASINQNPSTFFIGAAIENSMSEEIYEQMNSGSLSNAANLHHDRQLVTLCEWLINE